MDFIRSNKLIILGIIIGLVVVGGVFFVSTQTSLFNEDARLFNEAEENIDETGEVIVEDGEATEGSSTGILKAPKEIEGFVELPEESIISENTKEDGTFDGLETELTAFWRHNTLLPLPGDSSAARDLKEQARITSYEDYKTLQEDYSVSNVKENQRVLLGEVDFSPKTDVILKTNEIVELGDISIVGAEVAERMAFINLNIENKSDKVLDMEEVEKNIQFRFTEDYGMGTDWYTMEGFETSYGSVEDYNSGETDLDKYMGRDLVKTVRIPVIPMLTSLDTEGVADESTFSLLLGRIADKEELGEDYSKVKTYQDNLPKELKLEVKYGEEVSEYTILKSTDDVIYNYEEMVK